MTGPGPVWLDAARASLVAGCAACPSWRTLAGSRPEAQRAAADHLERVHDDHAGAAHWRELAARNATRRPNPK